MQRLFFIHIYLLLVIYYYKWYDWWVCDVPDGDNKYFQIYTYLVGMCSNFIASWNVFYLFVIYLTTSSLSRMYSGGWQLDDALEGIWKEAAVA
jgi:hypothetical protein